MIWIRASSERISVTFHLSGDTTPKDVLLFGRTLTNAFELTNSFEGVPRLCGTDVTSTRGSTGVMHPLRTYERGDRTNVAIEPESITEVDEATRDAWVAETARQTRERLEAFETGDSPFVAPTQRVYGEDTSPISEVLDGLTEPDDA